MKFADIKMTWRGQEYTLPAGRIMMTIAKVEDTITALELARSMQSGKPPLGKLAIAFAEVLNAAGARTDAEEVYTSLFGQKDNTAAIINAVGALLAMMSPPADFDGGPDLVSSKDAPQGNVEAPSSRKRTRRR